MMASNYLPKIILVLVVNLCFLFSYVFPQRTAFDLTILHTNDIQARFEQTDIFGGPCTQDLAASGMCVGGLARKVTKIKEVRQSEQNVLLLDNGEIVYGTPAWYETYGSLAASHFMAEIGYNATVSRVAYFVL